MKKIKVSMLALAVLGGGAVFASAANSSLTIASTEDIALTNAVPLVWSDVGDIPTSLFLGASPTNTQFFGDVQTDSSGKITGAGNLIKYYYSGTSVIGVSSFYVTVKGTIKASQMGVPSVQMALKGQGYTAPATNAVGIVNVQNSSSFPGTLNINFTAKNTAAISNNFAYHILGNLKGTVKPGLAAVNTKTITVNEPGDLIVNLNVQKELDLRVIVFGSKFAAILDADNVPSGTGNISKSGTYTLNLKPQNGGGSSLQLKGQVLAVTSPPFTNITTINTADVKGKIDGQAVNATAYKFGGFGFGILD